MLYSSNVKVQSFLLLDFTLRNNDPKCVLSVSLQGYTPHVALARYSPIHNIKLKIQVQTFSLMKCELNVQNHIITVVELSPQGEVACNGITLPSLKILLRELDLPIPTNLSMLTSTNAASWIY